MSRNAIAILACCLLACASGAFDTTTGAVGAQNGSGRLSEQAPEFEVASVKQNTSLGGERGAGFQPGGRFSAKNMTLRGLIAAAYGTPQPLPLYRVICGPGWIDSDRFDIEARASADLSDLPGKPGWSPRGQEMLRALLASRFRLVASQEARELQSYALVTARSDGRLGPQIAVSRDECERASPTGATPSSADSPPCGGFRFTPPERVSGRHLTMDEIARFIMLNAVDRPVLNRTELSGHFDIDLDFTRALSIGEPPVSTGDRQPAAVTGTSIFTAVQEQLGLKLEPARSQLEVVVIDAVARPEPD